VTKQEEVVEAEEAEEEVIEVEVVIEVEEIEAEVEDPILLLAKTKQVEKKLAPEEDHRAQESMQTQMLQLNKRLNEETS